MYDNSVYCTIQDFNDTFGMVINGNSILINNSRRMAFSTEGLQLCMKTKVGLIHVWDSLVEADVKANEATSNICLPV